jgi:FkbM family methyltransferase
MKEMQNLQRNLYKKLINIPNNWLDQIMFSIFNVYIKNGDKVVEVGANVGTHTKILQKLVGDNGTVFAFEPFKDNIARLKSNIDLEKNNVKIYELALSNSRGEADFKVFRDSPGTCGFIERPWYDKRKMETIKVSVDFIDNIKDINNIKLMKIDVEGADFNVIRGSEKLISNCRPLIIFEGGRKKSNPASLYNYTKNDFIDYFEKLNYVLYDNLGIKFDFNLWNEVALNDFIAIPKERHDELFKIVQLSVFGELYKKLPLSH